ncbi:MAG: DVUA0089 family protein [Planctomycetota bacterium]
MKKVIRAAAMGLICCSVTSAHGQQPLIPEPLGEPVSGQGLRLHDPAPWNRRNAGVQVPKVRVPNVQREVPMPFPDAPASFLNLGVVGDSTDTVTIETSGSNFDTELGLWDTAGSLLSLDDDGGPGLTSQISLPNLEAGEYFFSVSGWDTQFSPGFSADTDIFSDGGTAAGSVNSIPFSTTITPGDFAAINGEVQFYRFEISPTDVDLAIPLGIVADSNMTFSIDTAGSSFDTEIGLWDAVGTLLASNDDRPGGGVTSELSGQMLAPGTYFLAVAGFDSSFSSNFDVIRGPGSVGGTIAGQVNGTAISGSIPSEGVQFYRFEVEAAAPAGVRIGTNFETANRLQSFFIPPDTNAAIGPDHVAQLINGFYGVYTRDGALLTSSSLNGFWQAAGASTSSSFDPRIVYDPPTGRFYAVAVDQARSVNSGILVGVSRSSNPLDGWDGFRIDADSNNLQWADFPSLGIDADGIYVGANMFAVSSAPFNINFWVFPKASLLATFPSISGFTAFEELSPNDVGSILQPVVDLDGSGLPLPVASNFNTPAGFQRLSTVGGSIFSPSISGTAFISGAAFPTPLDAPQLNGPVVDTGDTRFSGNTVLQQGNLWAVQSVNVNGRVAIRWLRIDPNNGTLRESGLITDPVRNYSYPSIAVNRFGDIVIGCSGLSSSEFISSYAFTGSFNGSSTSFGPPILLRAGLGSYSRTDSVGRNRWGDYSSTVIDPTNERRFWTNQEFASTSNQWSTQLTQIIFEPPFETDVDLSGGVDVFDLLELLRRFDAGDIRADVDANGVLTQDDIEAYLFLTNTP